MHLVFSLITSLYLVLSIAETLEIDYREIGKTTFARVFIDPKSLVITLDRANEILIAGTVKILLNSEIDNGQSAYTINVITFSCANSLAIIMRSESFDSQGVRLQVSDDLNMLPWVKNSDTITNVLMTELCKDVKPKKSFSTKRFSM